MAGTGLIVFADTSAIVKLYANEVGSDEVRELRAVFVSQLCRVEVPAALWRKNRMGQLSEPETKVLIAAFENDLLGADAVLAPIRITPGILDDAAMLLEDHGLRAYDAIQLATARAARAIEPECRTVAVVDRQLRVAAAAVGFSLLPTAIDAV